jgi:hypothetical protein
MYRASMKSKTAILASEIRSQFESVKGVTAAIKSILPELRSQLERLCWINPSWILFGIKT